MTKFLPLGTTLALVIGAGVVHGLATNRWSVVGPGSATGNVAAVPRTVGHWVGHDLTNDPRQLALGNIRAACARRYRNRVTGASVQMLLVYGPSGPITVHTPDVCYPATGYELVAAPSRQMVSGSAGARPADFWATKARKEDPSRVSYLRILWAWSAAGAWEAPDYPRLAFCQTPMLYKLYVVQEMSGAEQPLVNDDCADFVRCLLPEVGPILFRQPAKD